MYSKQIFFQIYITFWFNCYDVKTSDFIPVNFQIYAISKIYKIYQVTTFICTMYIWLRVDKWPMQTTARGERTVFIVCVGLAGGRLYVSQGFSLGF